MLLPLFATAYKHTGTLRESWSSLDTIRANVIAGVECKICYTTLGTKTIVKIASLPYGLVASWPCGLMALWPYCLVAFQVFLLIFWPYCLMTLWPYGLVALWAGGLMTLWPYDGNRTAL